AAEIIGRKAPYPWWTEETTGQTSTDLKQAMRNGAKRLEELFQKKSGERFWVEITSSSIRKDGELKYYLANWVDITERRKIRKALQESEEQYRSLVNNVKLGIFRSEPRPLGKFLEVNPYMEEITGYSREELLQMNVSDLYANPRERDIVLEEATSARKKVIKELCFRKKDGAKITVSDTKFAIRDDGDKILYFDGVMEDITERKQMEQDLIELYAIEKKERRDLEEEVKARAEFINVLAHELKTPLTPVLACAAMLYEELSSSPESTQFRLVSSILSSVQATVKRLNELLDLARFTGGTFTLDIKPLDIKAFIEQLTAAFQPVIEAKGQCLLINLPQNAPIVKADHSRLEQVIINLLSNAIKFNREGGSITLRATTQKRQFVIEIEDQGMGISPEEKERILKPYHRVEQDRQRFPGLGLDIAISEEIIKAHGGKMWLTSQLGQGSTFSFSLPLRRYRKHLS
ncbi:MAG: PAS domain-containing sensor histidine kinase, partial [Chloroflexota bacterium]|nr:PAS domain-containing sensor histidine kinase [Chloroflexota bacterium]